MAYYGKGRYPKQQQTSSGTDSSKKKKWNGYKKPPPVVKEPHKPMSCPSEQQLRAFDEICNGQGNVVIIARAGCAKTTTIVESMFRLSAVLDTVYFVFNNKNAREAEAKVPDYVSAKTTHSFGYGCVKQAFGKMEIDSYKEYNIARSLVGDEAEKAELLFNLEKATKLAKCYLADNAQTVEEICLKHGIELCGETSEKFSEYVLKILDMSAYVWHIDPVTGEKSKQVNKVISFDDMIWYVLKFDLATPKYDIVFIDECQDLNKSRIELMMRAVREDGRIIAVGDNRQAIYGFSGADEHAVDNIVARTNAKILPLTTTYRCGKKIVELAREIVPDYEAAPSAPEGEVKHIGETKMMQLVQAGDFILSRTNAPLVPLCMQFLKAGIKANVQGKDLGKSLGFMIKRSKSESVEGFLTWLGEWKNSECDRLMKKNADFDHIVDKHDVLVALCEDAKTLKDVQNNISTLFDDLENDMARIILSSAHKSKGAERDNVFVLTDTFKRGRSEEEDNIWYVAITRARSRLFLVDGGGGEDNDEKLTENNI